MTTSILQGAPFWVWPVLAMLVWLGLKATQQRTVLAWPIYLMPLAGILSLNAVRGLGAEAIVWGMFIAAYLLGMFWGVKYQRNVVQHKSNGRVTLRGEWMTFLVLMTVFWMNFTGGVVQAMAPELYSSANFAFGFSAVAGLAAGSFMGRAFGTLRA